LPYSRVLDMRSGAKRATQAFKAWPENTRLPGGSIGGAVSGVGATRGWHSVRWIWGEKIVVAWVLTFPGASLIGAGGSAFAHFAIQPFIH
jgi:hypothetical protein